MSVFFQRLASQSGLTPSAVRPVNAPMGGSPPPALAPAKVFPTAPPPSSTTMETHEEVVSRADEVTTAPAPRPGPHSFPPPASASFSTEMPATDPPPPSPGRADDAVTALELTHSTILRSPSMSPPDPAAAPAARASKPSDAAPAKGNAGEQASSPPPDLMRAVMKWIAGGATAASLPPEASAPALQPDVPADLDATKSTSSAAPRPTPAAAAVPERAIRWAEESLELSRSAARSAETGEPYAPLDSASTPSAAPPVADNVTVSIGSIQVNVHAPPAAPAPAPAPHRVTPSKPTTPAPRAPRFSQLRRHYILPH